MNHPKKIPWRRWLRALHRDAGYLAIGLTFVYALSGIAVNHLEDWDPNFTQIENQLELPGNLPPSIASNSPEASQEIAKRVLMHLAIKEEVLDVYALDETHLDITLKGRTLYVDLEKGTLREEGQKERFLIRAANWLHLNRGKRAWTYIADGYALLLLYLATSGLFMLPGKKGILGRGAIFTGLGLSLPIVYVVLSGGP